MHVLHRVLLRRADGTDKIKRNFVHRKTQYQTTLSPEVWNMTWEKVTKQTARNEGVKEMRKSIAILLSVLLVLSCFALTACGKSEDLSGSKYVGIWKVDSLSFKDEEGELEGDYILTVNGDGSAQFVSEEGTSNCTWKLTKEGFKTKGDAKLKFKDDGDGIKAKILGAYLHFVRVPDGTTFEYLRLCRQ